MAMRSRRQPNPEPGARRRSGFTLVELLVVVAVVAVLLSVALPAIAGVRSAGARARELAAARSLVAAWQSYSHDSGGALLPGYRAGLSAYDARGTPIAEQTIGVAAHRWVWRLAPYLGHDLDELFVGNHGLALRELERSDLSDYLYQSSLFPSFGLNSVFVGGDESFGGFNAAFLGLFGKFHATRLSEIGQPASLVVFASSRGKDPAISGDESVDGFFRIRAPYFDVRVWAGAYDEADPASFGNVARRHGGAVATGFADGHVEARSPESLDDMRLWAPAADARDWRLRPSGG